MSKHGTAALLTETLTYRTPTSTTSTGQVAKLQSIAANYSQTLTYTYDANGNIKTVSNGTHTTTYTYDNQNQLIREDNQAGNFTHTWTYDKAGNILSRSEYAYTTGTLGAIQDTVTYDYSTDVWGDLLTSYDGTTISSDTIGNTLSDGTWTYTWEHGRELASKTSSAIRILQQPEDHTGVLDSTAVFSVAAEGTGLSYQWQWCSNSGSTWENSGLTGYATDTITVPVVEYRYGYQYRCVITDSAGNTVTSDACRLLPVEETWTYTYDANGMRIKRTNGYMPYSYIYIGSQLTQLTVGSNSTYITYDASNTPMTITYNKTVYYYVTNLQGDVTAILNASGTAVVEYTYDAWGNILSVTGSMADTLGQHNPLRYRGYVYDPETGLYYLQSRYYDPEIGRFINADDIAYLGADGSPLSYNLFAYCMNNPVNRFDVNGNWSLPNWAKVAIGVVAIAVGVIATAATGGAAAPVLVASLKVAATSAVVGAVSGAGISTVSHRVSTGSWEGAGKAAVTGAIDGAYDGFMWGGITAGASFTTAAAKGIKIQEIGKLNPSNKLGDGYPGVKYQAPKANGKYTTRSIELHSPHSSGSHNVWHWQQNTWNPYNNSITGSAKHWTIWGKRL